MISSARKLNQPRLNLLTQETPEMTNYRTRKLTNLHQVVDGVAAKDTTAKSIPPWRVQTTMGGLTAQLGITDRNTRLRLYTGTAVTAIGAHTSWLKIYKALEIFKSQSSAYFKLTSHNPRAKSLKRFMSYQTIHVQD